MILRQNHLLFCFEVIGRTDSQTEQDMVWMARYRGKREKTFAFTGQRHLKLFISIEVDQFLTILKLSCLMCLKMVRTSDGWKATKNEKRMKVTYAPVNFKTYKGAVCHGWVLALKLWTWVPSRTTLVSGTLVISGSWSCGSLLQKSSGTRR